MDLRNGNITLNEIMQNPRATALLRQAFPAMANNPMMMRMGRNMSLNRILSHARGRVPQSQINAVINQLRHI